MKVLLVGNGGREHAMAWRLKRSRSVTEIICPNGNPGIAHEARTPFLDLQTVEDWAAYAAAQKVDLVAVGPEAPLAAGLADACEMRGIPVFGPTREAARLEASKAFAKEVMLAADIPTARADTFTDHDRALDYARSLGLPVVVKADGLAAGKGVVICTTDGELQEALAANLKHGIHGASSRSVLVEEFLEGEETSILAFCDGTEVCPMAPSQDHKRAFDGDQGPNTGGMGAYAPAPVATEEVLATALSSVLRPAVDEMARRGTPYRGVLYAGLMLTADGPKVLEFNCRFGDPETQVVLPLLEGDLGEIMMACCEGRLGPLLSPGGATSIGVRPEHAACVVLASGGYPGSYEKGKAITGLEAVEGADRVVFHAGTRSEGDRILTNGGRVLGVTAWAASLGAAIETAYEMADRIEFEGKMLRRDIAHRALHRRSEP